MSSKLARSAGLIGAATMASRLLGVGREMVLAAVFGANAQMDAFNVAFRVPNLLRDLFAEGAMTAAFVPTFTRTLTSGGGKEAAWRLGNLVMNALILVTAVLALLGIFFAPQITGAFAPEFAETPGKLELTTDLTRIMLPFLTMLAVATAMMGMLNSLRRFFVPSLSPAMFNVASIFSALAIVPLMPYFGLQPIVGMAIGTLLGGLGQILLQWPTLKREGFRYQPIISFKDPTVLEILRLMGPATLGLAAVQVNVFVNTVLATGEPGAVSWLQYAFRLMYLPIGIFGVSIATASLPEISRQANANDLPAVRGSVSRGLRMMLMLNVPAMVGLMVLAEPIVAMIYQRGSFTPIDTVNTASALMFYAPGLIGYSAVKIASPTFYSLRDSRTPVIVSVLSVVANLALNLALVRVLGFKGLALGTGIAAVLNAVVLLALLRGRLGGLDGRRVFVSLLKITIASIAMGTAAQLTLGWLSALTPGGGELAKIVRVGGSIAAALLVLAASARLLRIHEFNEAIARVLARFRRRPA